MDIAFGFEHDQEGQVTELGDVVDEVRHLTLYEILPEDHVTGCQSGCETSQAAVPREARRRSPELWAREHRGLLATLGLGALALGTWRLARATR